MNHPTNTQDLSQESLLGQAADEFSERLNRGESPDIEEYAQRYPQVAELIRQVFPALSVLKVPPISESESDPRIVEPAGTRCLGDYRIVREVGRGGMGVVYEAEQVSLGRKVALKVLPFAAMLDQKQLQRFQNEARAAASLRHPNIVQVHFVGCERAVHFYAMDYIEGQTLAELIRHLRGLERPDGEVAQHAGNAVSKLADSLTSGRLSPPEASSDPNAPTAAYTHARTPGGEADTARGPQAAISTERSTKSPAYFRSIAEIGVQVAEALDHAHQNGVVHRDVKPSNVMLDNGGKPWVTDFGLARIETDATLTVTGDLLGTVRYMSPEQALAKRIVVDHRTDVYSLGATLYEMLTLQPVFTGQDRQELLRQIAFEEPKTPRKLNKAIPAELEIIVLKAMAKNPAERYDTAQDLADDLRRFLEDRPIRARRPTLVQRAAKWSRRHKPVVAATVVLLVMATLGSASGTYLLAKEKTRTEDALGQSREAERKAREAEENERKLAKEAQRLKRQAEKNLERSRANLERALNAADQLVSYLEDDRFFVAPEVQELRQTVLNEALELFQAFIDENGTDPVVRFQAASAYRKIAAIQIGLGRFAEAERASEQAIGLAEQLAAEFPGERKYRVILAESNRELGGMLLHGADRVSAAERPLRRAAGLYERLIADSPDGVAQQSDVATYRHGRIHCHSGLALVLRLNGKYEEAEELHRPLPAEAEKLAAEFPGVPGYLQLAAFVWRERARHLHVTGHLEEASEAVHRALKIQDRIIAKSPEKWAVRWEMSLIHREFGYILKKQGKWQEAEQSYRKETALLAELALERPLFHVLYRDMAKGYHNMGDIIREAQRLEEAIEVSRRALDPLSKLVAIAPHEALHRQQLAESCRRLGSVLEEASQYEKAEEAYRQEQRLYEKLAEDFPNEPSHRVRLLQVQLKLIELLKAADRDQEAAELWRSALAVLDECNEAIRLAPDDPGLYGSRGEAYLAFGRYDEALTDWNRYVELKPDDSLAALIRAQMLLMAGRTEEYRRACGEMLDRFGQSEHLGQFYDAARACVLTRNATRDPMVPIELAERAVSRYPRDWTLYTLGMAHLRAGQLDEAAQRFQESLKRAPSWDARFLNWLGLALVRYERGDMEDARQWLGKAVDLMNQSACYALQHQIEGQLLRREVEQLLGEPEQAKDDAESEKEE